MLRPLETPIRAIPSPAIGPGRAITSIRGRGGISHPVFCGLPPPLSCVEVLFECGLMAPDGQWIGRMEPDDGRP